MNTHLPLAFVVAGAAAFAALTAPAESQPGGLMVARPIEGMAGGYTTTRSPQGGVWQSNAKLLAGNAIQSPVIQATAQTGLSINGENSGAAAVRIEHLAAVGSTKNPPLSLPIPTPRPPTVGKGHFTIWSVVHPDASSAIPSGDIVGKTPTNANVEPQGLLNSVSAYSGEPSPTRDGRWANAGGSDRDPAAPAQYCYALSECVPMPQAMLRDADGIIHCESRHKADAISPTGDYGLFQLNRIHEARANRMGYTWAQMLDPEANIAVAISIWQEQSWRPWACAGRMGVR